MKNWEETLSNSPKSPERIWIQRLQIHECQIERLNVLEPIEGVRVYFSDPYRERQMPHVLESRERVAVYRVQRIMWQCEKFDVLAADEGVALDEAYLVVGQENEGDILQGGEREFAHVIQRRVLYRQPLELLESAEGEPADRRDVVAIQQKFLQVLKIPEGVVADYQERQFRQGEFC